VSAKNIGEDDFGKREKSLPLNLIGSPIVRGEQDEIERPMRNRTEPSNLIIKSQFAPQRKISNSGFALQIPKIPQ
jgi:hypothetical protein